MNASPNGAWPEPEHEAWRSFDDTLADGPSPADVPDAAKPWLAEQRLLHGLLRSLHTADAGAREGRVAAVMALVDREVSPSRARWAIVAAAALVLASIGTWLALPDRLPTAEAAMSRAVAELARDVDRRYRLELEMVGANGKEAMRTQFALVTRPGSRFRVEGKIAFGGFQLGEIRIGCDGQELWVLPANGAFRRASPLAEKERLMRGFGDVLDLGYLDVHDLVAKLPVDLDLHVVAREQGEDGRRLLHIEARRKEIGRGHLRSAQLWCDDETGMVTRIEVDAEDARGISRHLRLAYLGEEPTGFVDYSRPW